MYNFRLLLMCAVVYLSGCKTTGDPTKGGLFGWDEEKAKQRQAALERRAININEQMRALETENASRNHTNKALQVTLTDQKKQLEELLTAREQLIDKVALLVKSDDANQAKITQLQTLHPWLNTSREEVLREFRKAKQEHHRTQLLDKLELEMTKLVKEIDMLD